MKSQTITIVSIVGVLGLASAAMVVNADTLSSIGAGAGGAASEVLVPVSTDAPLVLSPSPTVPVVPAMPTPAAVAPLPAPTRAETTSGTDIRSSTDGVSGDGRSDETSDETSDVSSTERSTENRTISGDDESHHTDVSDSEQSESGDDD
ncbi:hypothetical protein JF66_20075 [Cryobacterium sp. MLB-32]|uniref:hypothetical protein n=1 Tax=Cryobacterium sp. MLB-32 TaxID=1529318 RepID=UPI0004E72735|nr:hypothetical protein [Cryobacterium sp. MLB-32]KFF58234.1 hypothetical protein JF66_20075 [Cryobacterium sp. MLB-32]